MIFSVDDQIRGPPQTHVCLFFCFSHLRDR
uniref:Uncharacterized protein n=1 Tax=Anguilla anguilla TaxID=7936 RepID=A0A0E9WCS6_ANGAN